ncbi:hypothetical protein B0A50_07133 [Salinomyces thailandicus]|uniref:Uncharacterized protein n=1 Tax=Salinomyces thailandicus TaxID=706561 RepID=A0A4U0TP96_9PEZI|nr:hypothetical protein B0A50_07133 [Salinomyces thailandica]
MRNFAFLSFAVAASASIFERQEASCNGSLIGQRCIDDYLSAVCHPTNSTTYSVCVRTLTATATAGASASASDDCFWQQHEYLDFSAPCNAANAIGAQCQYGVNGINAITLRGDLRYQALPPQTPESERACICQSRLIENMLACDECYNAHGAEEPDRTADLASLSSSYCAVSNTPTTGWNAIFRQYYLSLSPLSLPTSTSSTATSLSDPIGNKTAISYYYTPSITGSDAYIVGLPTPTDFTSASTATRSEEFVTNPVTSNGQIIATAGLDERLIASSTSSAASSSSTAPDNGSGKREISAGAGVVAVAAMIALM